LHKIKIASATQLIDRIDKLNSNNYQSWKFNMKMALVQRELWKHVTGEAVRPTDNENEIERSIIAQKKRL